MSQELINGFAMLGMMTFLVMVVLMIAGCIYEIKKKIETRKRFKGRRG